MVMLSRPAMLRLIGYTRADGGGYQLLHPDERDWLWLAPVRTWLGIENGAVVCYNEAGVPLGNYRALARALNEVVSALNEAETAREAAEQRAEAEARAREGAEARLRELEATIRQLKGEK
jgi:hypothetical protein